MRPLVIYPALLRTYTSEAASAAASGGGEVTYCTLTAPQGTAYILLAASCYHDDTGNSRVPYFSAYDGTTTTILYTEAAVAPATMLQLYDKLKCTNPLVITQQNGIRFGAAALTAAKKAYIRYWVALIENIEAV